MRWTAEQVRAEAAAWVWLHPESREVRAADYHLVSYPAATAIPTMVLRTWSERDADEVVDEVLEVVRGWGCPDVSFWVGEDTRPTDLAARLLARGATHVETVEVLALDLADGLPLLGARPEVEVRPVDDLATARDATLVSQRVWGSVPPDDEELARQVAERGPDELRVVAYRHGDPAAAGGCTLAGTATGRPGEVARLWGAATREEHRGHGAYRAVLHERLRLARERGATLGLVKGLVDTSAPILRSLGFTPYGREDRYRLETQPGGAQYQP